MRPRVHIGPQLRVVAETDEGVELEGKSRLRPGQPIDLVRDTGSPSDTPRAAVVFSWFLVGLGRDGPVYRGHCRWH